MSQAAFARFTGVTPRQVNNWCRGRAAVPARAELAKVPSASADGMPVEGALIAVVLDVHSPEALTIILEEVLQILADAEPEQPAVEARSIPPAR